MTTGLVDNLNLKASLSDGVLIAFFKCQKIGDFEAPPLRTEIESLAPQAGWKIVADLSNVFLLGSPGIGMLVTLKKNCDLNKGRLIICGLSDELMGLLKIAALTKLFVIKKDTAEALRSF
jgi:anti-anti-sigma factor